MDVRNYVERPDTYAHSPFAEIVLAQTVTLTDGSAIKFPFDTVITNEMGAWDAVNKWFLCPKAGRVQVNLSLSFNLKTVPSNASLAELIVQNSAGENYRVRRFGQYNSYPGGVIGIVGSTIVNVNLGDKLWLSTFVFGNTDVWGTVAGSGVELTFITFCYLP